MQYIPKKKRSNVIENDNDNIINYLKTCNGGPKITDKYGYMFYTLCFDNNFNFINYFERELNINISDIYKNDILFKLHKFLLMEKKLPSPNSKIGKFYFFNIDKLHKLLINYHSCIRIHLFSNNKINELKDEDVLFLLGK